MKQLIAVYSYCSLLSPHPHFTRASFSSSLTKSLLPRIFLNWSLFSLLAVLDPRTFCAFVHPVLEVSSVLWNPYVKMDINQIENIQRRFTEAIFPQLPYSGRLVKLHLPTLEMRRVMADLILSYKLSIIFIDIDSGNFFLASNNTRTRGNSRKLQKIIYWISVLLIYSINFWNKLPDSVVSATSISCFKRRLLSFVLNFGSEHFYHD